MSKLSKKEKREMIAAAMKTISQHKSLTTDTKKRGLDVLEKAFIRNSPPK